MRRWRPRGRLETKFWEQKALDGSRRSQSSERAKILSGRRAVAENRRRSDTLEGNGGEESLWAKRINREQKSKKIGLEWFAQRPITCTDSTAVHGSYIASSWDFYKPDLTSEYVCPPLIPTFLPFYCPTCLTSQSLARTKCISLTCTAHRRRAPDTRHLPRRPRRRLQHVH